MGKVLRREGLGAGAGLLPKAEAARSECSLDLSYNKLKNRQLAVF
ncbi:MULTISPECIES: hypothetical protein [Bacillus]|nr:MULTISPECIES: hypothetical protein [Bacillus]MCU5113928.1 hypothetical protein [Bacillus wiedmannii]MCU5153827.1 hypothetical protein [Bacillus wiedmannii]MCU5413547.1 hypothetical protein [Bacillus wiedmannii]MCU5599195.1 hypothetical protein [Bacillus wiedmannii]MCX3314550.1 hypothetical protein [Bacillus wiedmannii]